MAQAKYQVFISSTYVDLKKERDQVMKAVLEMGHIPVGMEMFSAANEEQWKIITRQIDGSDYYAVIVAHRYGSIVRELNISYTEREYDYAISKGVPVIGFVIETGVDWPVDADHVDTDTKSKQRLNKFKGKVKGKPVNFWRDADDLHGKFAIALMKLTTTDPRPGWIRGNQGVGPDVTNELSRLSKENADLRMELSLLKNYDDSKAKQASAWVNGTMRFSYSAQMEREIAGAFQESYESGEVEVFWYTILGRLFDLYEKSFTGNDVLNALSVLGSKDAIKHYSRGRPTKVVKCSVYEVILVVIATGLMSNGIIEPIPSGEAKSRVWHFTEEAGYYRQLIQRINGKKTTPT